MNRYAQGAGIVVRIIWSIGVGIGRVVKLNWRTNSYPVGQFTLAYIGVLAVTVVGFIIDVRAGVPVYALAGYTLSRFVLAQLDWNSFEYSLADIARVKILALIFWPIMYPPFLLQLVISRYL
jgi:hypothetical protein